MTQENPKQSSWYLRPLAVFVAALAGLTGCKSSAPASIGLHGGELSQCPNKPNCVLSQNADADHAIAPLVVKAGSIEEVKALLRTAAESYEKETLAWVKDEGNYLWATFTTPLMRYVDDVEFLIVDDLVHVRSASRVGYGDMGANRARIEAIRAALP